MLEEGASAAADRSRDREDSASRWGRSACRTSRATTSAGTSASVTTKRHPKNAAACASRIASASSAVSGRRAGLGWYRYEAGQTRCDCRIPRSTRSSTKNARRSKHQTAQDCRMPRSSIGWCSRSSNEGARILEEGIAAARVRHRRGLSRGLRISACSAAGRCSMPSRVGTRAGRAPHEAVRGQPHAEPAVLETRDALLAKLAAAGKTLRRRAALEYAETKRSAPWLTPSSFRPRARRSRSPGAAHSTSRTARRSAVTSSNPRSSARVSSPPPSKTWSWAARIRKAPPASTSRGRSRCAPDVRSRRPGMTVNRYCSSGLQTIALAAQRIMAGEGEMYVAGGVESISCVQNDRINTFMAKEAWLDEHKPAIYWPMLQTAETVAKRYGIAREAQDRYGVQSQQRAAAALAAGRFADEIVPIDVVMGAADKDSGRLVDAQGHGERGRGHPRRHELRGGREDPRGDARRRDRRRQREPVLRWRVGLRGHERDARGKARAEAAGHFPRLRGRGLRARRDGHRPRLRDPQTTRARRAKASPTSTCGSSTKRSPCRCIYCRGQARHSGRPAQRERRRDRASAIRTA